MHSRGQIEMGGKNIRSVLIGLLSVSILSQLGMCQDLHVDFFEAGGNFQAGSDYLVSNANPEKKAIVAGLLVKSQSILELQENVKSKGCSTSLKLLCAWELAAMSARSRLLSGQQKTEFRPEEYQPFIKVIEQCVAPVPSTWIEMLKSGEYLINDRFDPFAVYFEYPPNLRIDMKKEKIPFLDLESHRQLLPSLKEIAEPILVAFKKTDDGEILLIEDDEDYWGYFCAKIKDTKLVWLTRVEPQWVFLSGGMRTVDLVIGEENQVVVFCALAGTLSINAFDIKSGKRTICFSNLVGRVDGFVIRPDEAE